MSHQQKKTVLCYESDVVLRRSKKKNASKSFKGLLQKVDLEMKRQLKNGRKWKFVDKEVQIVQNVGNMGNKLSICRLWEVFPPVAALCYGSTQ